ncbi:hypothetical protein HMPREF0731_3226 [Pseudoroseomonas cervicalis ATCC 49957]|uniref:Transposase IS4-like domain-containing protein n=1 Tax=Pseudoroseomonas cervicalis ATCC 49957 TaxID=525371 RepID=D5RQ64_9PROT|nr:hypothetical protein HMPREF0731_3226 [Pseudoroseomonas cervicalis ATCC 49957]
MALGMSFLDSTSMRAHHNAEGAEKRAHGRERDWREALGRSRGGYGTTACVIADGRGRAIAFALAPGQAHELPLASGLLDSLPDAPGWIIGDRGYASDAFRGRFRSGRWAYVPPFHPSARMRRSPVPPGSATTVRVWRTSGRD